MRGAPGKREPGSGAVAVLEPGSLKGKRGLGAARGTGVGIEASLARDGGTAPSPTELKECSDTALRHTVRFLGVPWGHRSWAPLPEGPFERGYFMVL